ncbi:MAG: glycosyltransferase family 2 protein [Acidimicrobiales bacterium]
MTDLVDASGAASGDLVVGAVVVNHNAGGALADCVASLRADGVTSLVVVDNASSDDSLDRLDLVDRTVTVLRSSVNLGYGRGANKGLAELTRSAHTPDVPDLVLVCNPDLVVHAGATTALAKAVRDDSRVAIAGPRILEEDGTRYPSARRFPSWIDAAGHVLLGALRPDNPFTRRYRMADLDASVATDVDWVSGACFLARRSALEGLGGFDESYFMYMEDVDLCWRAHRSGYLVRYVPTATVTHVQGLSTARHPYRMAAIHHWSALRFSSRRLTGWRRVALVPVAVVLSLRLVVALARQVVEHGHGGRRRAD